MRNSPEQLRSPVSWTLDLAIFPTELIHLILSYLDAISVVKAAFVSKNWRIVCLCSVLWRKLYLRSYPLPAQSLSGKFDWYGLFRQRKRLERNWETSRFINSQLPHPQHADEGHTDEVYAIQLSGRYLVSGSKDTTIRVWCLDTQRLAREPLRGHDKAVLCLQCDANVIISGSRDTDVIVWDFSSGEMVKRIKDAHQGPVFSLGFNHQFLVTSSKDATIKIWNRQEYITCDKDRAKSEPLPAYSVLKTLKGHSDAVNTIQIHEERVVSASADRTIRLWNIHTGECLGKFTLPRSVACIQFDGQRIVSGSRDGLVRIFDCWSKTELACLHNHRDLVRSVQGRIDCRSLGIIVSGSYDGSVVLWREVTKDKWILHDYLTTEAGPVSASSVPDSTGLGTLGPIRRRAGGAVSSSQDRFQHYGHDTFQSTRRQGVADCATPSAKIFGLHIDPRSIVCCSQRRTIEVWDFANGDDGIIRASGIFAPKSGMDSVI